MQTQLLERNPDADLRVYAVWLNPYGRPPARVSWDPNVLADERVTHVWDPDRIVGTWFAEARDLKLGYPGDVVWDAWLLFEPDARWPARTSHLVGFGWTVIGTRDELERKVTPLL